MWETCCCNISSTSIILASIHCEYQYPSSLARVNALHIKILCEHRRENPVYLFFHSHINVFLVCLSLFPIFPFYVCLCLSPSPSLLGPRCAVSPLESAFLFSGTINSCLQCGITKIVTMDTLPANAEWPFPSSKRSNYLMTSKTGDDENKQNTGIAHEPFHQQGMDGV